MHPPFLALEGIDRMREIAQSFVASGAYQDIDIEALRSLYENFRAQI